MSQEASIVPLILDIITLLSTSQELGHAQRKVDSWKTHDGQTHKVEHVVSDGTGREFGLQKTEKGFKLLTDCHGLTPEQQKKQTASINQIVQKYAYKKVVEQLKRDGYTIAEEGKKGEDIRLVARKWQG